MKKSELNSKAKAEIKKIKKEIEDSLIDKLKAVTAKLGEATDKLAKEIEKGSKKLAKKVTKELHIGQSPVEKQVPNPKVKPVAAAQPKTGKKPEPKKVTPTPAKPVPAIKVKKIKAVKPKTAPAENKKVN